MTVDAESQFALCVTLDGYLQDRLTAEFVQSSSGRCRALVVDGTTGGAAARTCHSKGVVFYTSRETGELE